MNPMVRDALIGGGVGLVAGALMRSPKAGAAFGALLWPAYQARQRTLLGLGAAAPAPYLDAHTRFKAMGTWSEGTPVRKNWQAVAAVRTWLNRAATENPAKASYYREEMKKAAYKLLGNTVPDIFRRGVGYLTDATKAKKGLQLVAKEYYYAVEAPSVSKPASGRSSKASIPSEESAAAPSSVLTVATDVTPWWVTYRFPLAGGIALLAAGGLWLVLGARRG